MSARDREPGAPRITATRTANLLGLSRAVSPGAGTLTIPGAEMVRILTELAELRALETYLRSGFRPFIETAYAGLGPRLDQVHKTCGPLRDDSEDDGADV